VCELEKDKISYPWVGGLFFFSSPKKRIKKRKILWWRT